jgi:hypothetical protein
MKSRVRRLHWPELALTALSLLIALGAIEIGLRLRLSPRARAALPHVGLDEQDENRLRWVERRRERRDLDDAQAFDRADPLLGWSPIPDLAAPRTIPGASQGVVHTNADGLRGATDVPRERQPGRGRIAIFGCSQTFGAEVADDETYSARLQSLLGDVDVLNFGVHGFGTDQMLLRYERDGRPYRPDVVVVGFAYYHLQRNLDAFRFFAKPRFVLDGTALRIVGVPVPTAEEYGATAVLPQPSALLDASVLLRFGWQTLLRRRELALYTEGSPAWTLTRAILARFAEEVRADGARFVLLNVEDDARQLEPVLDATARADGATFVNAALALGPLRAAGQRLRVPRNPHWGPRGHSVIARELATAICRERIVSAAGCAEPHLGAGGPARTVEPRTGSAARSGPGAGS